MYGASSFGSAPFASPPLTAVGGGDPLPEPLGGGNFMLLGVRAYWWALLLLPFLS